VKVREKVGEPTEGNRETFYRDMASIFVALQKYRLDDWAKNFIFRLTRRPKAAQMYFLVKLSLDE
jgi:hypothetical protein